MGLDIDYIAGKEAIEQINKVLSSTPHGEREEIADKIIAFVKLLTITSIKEIK